MTTLIFLALSPAEAGLHADAGGPYEVPAEGVGTLDASSSVVDGWCHSASYRWDLDGDGEWDSQSSSVEFYAAGIDGPDVVEVVLQVEAWCPAWPETDTDMGVITVDNVPPAIEGLVLPDAWLEGDTWEIEVVFDDPEPADTHTVLWTLPGGEVTGPVASFQALDDGSFFVDVRVIDDDGGEDEASFQVLVENVDPEISGRPDDMAVVGELYAFAPAVVDPGADSHTWSGDGPAGVTIDAATGAVAWTPTAPDVGDHDFVLEVTDDDGGSYSITWTVDVYPEGTTDADGDGIPDDQVAIQGGSACGCSGAPWAVGWVAVLVLPWLRRRR